MASEMQVMKANEYRVKHDRLVLDGQVYELADVREGLRLLAMAKRAEEPRARGRSAFERTYEANAARRGQYDAD